ETAEAADRRLDRVGAILGLGHVADKRMDARRFSRRRLDLRPLARRERQHLPARARPSAIARPNPRPAPVTIATLSLSVLSISHLLRHRYFEPDQHSRLQFARRARERSEFRDGRLAARFTLPEVRCQPVVVSECLYMAPPHSLDIMATAKPHRVSLSVCFAKRSCAPLSRVRLSARCTSPAFTSTAQKS